MSTNTPVSVRSLRDGDIPAIADIYNDNVINTTTTYELEPLSLPEMSDRLSAVTLAGFPCFVAEESCDNPRILGYAYGTAFRPRPAYRFTVEHSVYVASGARGRGVGTLLMRCLIRECERLGFRQIVAVIGDGKPDNPSVLFHIKLGFRDAGRLEGSGYKFGSWLDTTLMQLTISRGTESPPDPASLPETRFREH
jgi:phosphinothricin acetyltransferase